MDLGSKTAALVTGGSQGVGYAIARGFAEGCSAVIARDEARLRNALAELRQVRPGGRKMLRSARRGAPEALADEFKDTDILVNNAGAIPTGDIFSVDEAALAREAAGPQGVRLHQPDARHVPAHARARTCWVIVNVLVPAARSRNGTRVCGNAANVAMGVTKSLGGRSIDDGIRVVGVNPGGVETERMTTNQRWRAQREFGDLSAADIWSGLPLGRAATPGGGRGRGDLPGVRPRHPGGKSGPRAWFQR